MLDIASTLHTQPLLMMGSPEQFGLINIDVIDICNYVFDKVSDVFDWLASLFDGFDVAFDAMWSTLHMDDFADGIVAQANVFLNTVGPVFLTQVATLTAYERDGVSKILNYMSDALYEKHGAFCHGDIQVDFPLDMLNMVVCTEKAEHYVDLADKYLFKLPIKAFDLEIDVINEVASCEDLLDCEPDVDALFEKYPEFDIDLDFLDDVDTDYPFEFLF